MEFNVINFNFIKDVLWLNVGLIMPITKKGGQTCKNIEELINLLKLFYAPIKLTRINNI